MARIYNYLRSDFSKLESVGPAFEPVRRRRWCFRQWLICQVIGHGLGEADRAVSASASTASVGRLERRSRPFHFPGVQ